jgi:hypothetical protein
VWLQLLLKLSSEPETRVDRRDLVWILAILASFATGLWMSWERWGNPLVDSGRELNVPLRLLHGEMLYSQVAYIYGPLSPYLNAFLYCAFRPSLWVLWAHGIFATLVILGLTYWTARQITGRVPATIACLAVTWACALKPQGNYMLPYSFGGLDGCIFVSATVAFLIVFVRKNSYLALAFAGVAAALAILSKIELGGAAVATGTVAILLAGYPRVRTIASNLALFFLPGLGVPAFVFCWFAARVGWPTLLVDSHLFFGHVPWQLVYFNGVRFGFDHPWHSAGLMIASLFRLIALAGIVISVSQLIEMIRQPSAEQMNTRARPALVLVLLLVSTLIVILTGKMLSDLGPFLPMPILLLVSLMGGGYAYFAATRDQNSAARLQSVVFIIIATNALFSLARIVLRVSTGGALSSFLLPGSVIIFVYLWVDVLPVIPAELAVRKRVKQLIYFVLAASLSITAITISSRYKRKFWYPVHSAMGTWRTTPELGIAFSQALQLVESRTRASDSVAVMPEGTALLFFSGRRNPLREEIVTPGFLDSDGEKRNIEQLRKLRTPMVFIANRITSEFGQSRFGIDYDQLLMKWIEANYAPCGLFSARPDPTLQIGAPVFFFRAYCLNSSDR